MLTWGAAVQSWDGLRVRTCGHRCVYALHHRAAPTEPLAFTSVALRAAAPAALADILAPEPHGAPSYYAAPTPNLNSSAESVLEENILEGSSGLRVAVFYSLCATQPVRASCLCAFGVS